MSWRPWLEPGARIQMAGLPSDAFDSLVRVLARICDDPFDRLHSMPVSADARDRVAELGDSGFIEFTVDEADGLVRVYRLVWTG